MRKIHVEVKTVTMWFVVTMIMYRRDRRRCDSDKVTKILIR